MNNRTRKSIHTNTAASNAYALYIKALRAQPANETAIETARATLAAVITAEAAAGAPGTGFEAQSVNRDGTPAVTRTGAPITASGMKPGTPFALIMHQEGRSMEPGKAWPCGSVDSAGPSCFAL